LLLRCQLRLVAEIGGRVVKRPLHVPVSAVAIRRLQLAIDVLRDPTFDGAGTCGVLGDEAIAGREHEAPLVAAEIARLRPTPRLAQALAQAMGPALPSPGESGDEIGCCLGSLGPFHRWLPIEPVQECSGKKAAARHSLSR
jgi:hypothetical protein